MGVGSFVLAGAAVLAAAYGVLLYNRLVALKHGVDQAWANIGVLLAQRHDEIPKLVDTCREYMRYEQETLERVVRARQAVETARRAGDVEELGKAEDALRSGLERLFALAEAYPELKASETFRQLSSRISELENAIADRRELYNDAVNRNNVRIEQFPDLLVARLFGFGPRQLLRFGAERTADPDVSTLFAR
ncbi:MAG: hypothetical protein KatS3mg124_1463 [Porticoccaceae bacterium]|nr:MAG: hypothetical protein KatS3mg124_1463 [Porticoccaceae bacterium]